MLRRREAAHSPEVRFAVVGAIALLVLFSGVPGDAAELNPIKAALNCNSDVEVRETGLDPMDPTGQTFMVMIEVSNVESNDVANVPVTQEFPVITFFPSCTSTIPCVPGEPMGSPPGTLLEFVPGSASSDCPGALNMAALGAGFVDFSFTPTLALGPNAHPDLGPDTSCNIFFSVRTAMPAPVVPTTFLMEATTTGTCQIPFPIGTFTSNTTGTDDVLFAPMVPTLGQIALAGFALLLVAGSLAILRRRQAHRLSP